MGCGTSKAPHAPQRQKREAARSSRISSTVAEQGSAGRPTPSTVQSPAEDRSARRSRLASSELAAWRASPRTPRSASLTVEQGSSAQSSLPAVQSPAEDRSTRRSRLPNIELPAQRASPKTPRSTSLIVEQGSTPPLRPPNSEPSAQRASPETQRSASLLVQQGSSSLLHVPSIHSIAERGSSRSSSIYSSTGPAAELEPRNLFANWEQEAAEKPQVPGSAMEQEIALRSSHS